MSDRDGTRDIYRLGIDDGRAVGTPERLTVGLNAHVVALAGDDRLVCSVLTYRTNLWSMPIPAAPDVATLAGARQVTTGNQIIEASDVSPDGRTIAFDSNLRGNQDIYTMPAAGGEPVAITTDPANVFAPSWSPDGWRLAFHSFRSGTRHLFVTVRDGGHVAQVDLRPGERLGAAMVRRQPHARVLLRPRRATSTCGASRRPAARRAS